MSIIYTHEIVEDLVAVIVSSILESVINGKVMVIQQGLKKLILTRIR
jgi:hypothetical protein